MQEEKKGKELRLKVLGLRLYCVGLVFDKSFPERELIRKWVESLLSPPVWLRAGGI